MSDMQALIDLNAQLLEALELHAALDAPYSQGSLMLSKAGWKEEERFELSASDFVARKTEEAIKKAKEFKNA